MNRAVENTVLLLVTVGTWIVPVEARAQGRVEVGLRGSYLPLYSGDATVGSTHGWGVTTQIAVTLDSSGATEVSGFYTLVPRDKDPYNRTPRIQMAGGMVSLSRGIESRLTGVGMLGLGIIDYSPVDLGSCELPLCFAEGGGSYGRERHPTFIAGVGVEGALTPRVRIRIDVKQHLPLGADDATGGTGERRTDVGVGLRVLLR
jgi:hypothetical protein